MREAEQGRGWLELEKLAIHMGKALAVTIHGSGKGKLLKSKEIFLFGVASKIIHIYNPSTQEPEAWELLTVQDKPGLHY